MKLTGKALDAFKSWYEVKYGKHYSWSIFIDLPLSFQFGVYQDWADSIGYEIGVTSSDIGFAVWFNDVWIETHKTRQEARNAAIEKLNQIVNEK